MVPNSRRVPPPHRVLVIEPQGRAGIWHYAYSLALALADLGFETALATTFPYEDLGGHDAVAIWPINTRIAGSRWQPEVLRQLTQHVDKVRRLFQLLREFQPSVVHLHGPIGRLDFLYFRFMKALKARVVYTAHDANPLNRRANWADWARYRGADAILVHSTSGIRELVSAGIERSRISLIAHPNYLRFCPPIDATQGNPKSRLGLAMTAQVILFFGAIAPYKGLDILIEAFGTLCHEGTDCYLIVAGEPLEDFTPYERLIEKLGIRNRVILDLRYIPFGEFPKYFASADVVVLPYRRVYQSGILQLAYGFGRPVVVTRVGGVGEVVAEDGTGIVVPTLRPEALASAIREVLGKRTMAEEMGRRARQMAESKYAWESAARQIEEIYRLCATVLPARSKSIHRSRAATKMGNLGGPDATSSSRSSTMSENR